MFMNYKILIGKPLTHKEMMHVEQLIAAVFEQINTIYNKWNPHSELSQLNRLKAGERRVLSNELFQFLKQMDEIVKMTQGHFDPTIEPIQQLWKTKLEQGVEPTSEEIAQVTPAIGWHLIHVEDSYFYKDHDATALDLGGIAKGLAVDLLVERLNEAGYTHLFVEWGGEIRATGSHPNNRPWTIFISRFGDNDPDHAIAQLKLTDAAIATSGDYLQNWTLYDANAPKEIVTYFHIFDPQTYQPLVASSQSIASASIIAPTCVLADALATAAMLFTSKMETLVWLREVQIQYPSVELFLFTREEVNLNQPIKRG